MSPPTTNKRILLVEDNPNDEKLITFELRRSDPTVVVERVETAVALRGALRAASWDAVVSDWSLPGFDAMAALAIVRELAPDLPFIIVSGTIGEEAAVTAMRAGANDYVGKSKLTRLPVAIEREVRDCKQRLEHRRQAHRFRALTEKTAEGVVLTSVDREIVYASPALSTIVARSNADLLGMRVGDLVHPEDRAGVDAAMSQIRELGGSIGPVECRIVRPDGAIRWVSYSATNLLDDPDVCAIVTNLRDDTALHTSEHRFARLAEAGVLGIVTCDRTGAIIAANQTYANLIGYSIAELTSGAITWSSLIPSDQRPDQLAARFGAHGDVLAPVASAVIRKDGVVVPILVGAAPIDDETSIAFCVDLTEQKRAEAALQSTTEQLRQVQKLDAIGRLAGGVAHDFNNVLSVIMGYAGMLMSELDPDDTRYADAAEIQIACDRAASLTRQLLMFSRQQVLEPKILDITETLNEMNNMLRRMVGEDIALEMSCATSLVKADRSSLEQVIMNLAVNARDAMPTGGTLRISTTNVVHDERPHVKIVVCDDGVGMDEATRQRIFESFYTTKPKDKGTGLGLSIVFGIVKQSGGDITVTSVVGEGTTFEIFLPIAEGEVETVRGGRALALRGSETILLVEDDDQLRVVASSILRRYGYTVLESATPAEALGRSERYPGEVHLLLTDVVMPQMSGPALAKLLLKVRPNMRVVCMSGYTDDSIVRHGVETSSIAFLQKPITPDALTHKVRDVLDQA